MDFLKQELKMNSFEEYEEDDDVFYDELRRQILQLTAEDDDEVYERKAMEARKQGPYRGVAQPVCCNGWAGIKEDYAATPAWILNLWRSSSSNGYGNGNGNGTGVFIPQGVQSKRKNRSRRKNDRGRAYRRVERIN